MNILFVCTGNTCRSPMAEALLRAALAAKGNTQVTCHFGRHRRLGWRAGLRGSVSGRAGARTRPEHPPRPAAHARDGEGRRPDSRDVGPSPRARRGAGRRAQGPPARRATAGASPAAPRSATPTAPRSPATAPRSRSCRSSSAGWSAGSPAPCGDRRRDARLRAARRPGRALAVSHHAERRLSRPRAPGGLRGPALPHRGSLGPDACPCPSGRGRQHHRSPQGVGRAGARTSATDWWTRSARATRSGWKATGWWATTPTWTACSRRSTRSSRRTGRGSSPGPAAARGRRWPPPRGAGRRSRSVSRSDTRRRSFETWARRSGAEIVPAAECRVIINTTPLGLSPGDAQPSRQGDRAERLRRPRPGVLGAGETPWVRAMRAARPPGRRRTRDAGGAGRPGLERWFPGADAPTEVMRAAVDAALR